MTPDETPSNPDRERWVGWWVAIKDGKVVAKARTSAELLDAIAELGSAARGVEAHFVAETDETLLVGAW